MSDKPQTTEEATPKVPQIRRVKIEKGEAGPIQMKFLRFTRPIDLPNGDVPEGIKGRLDDNISNSPSYLITFLPWLRKYHIACYAPGKLEPEIRLIDESHVLIAAPI